MLKNIGLVIVLLFAFASLALAQGAAPAPPFVGWWDARWSGVKANDSVTDQTSALSTAKLKAKTLGRSLFIPNGVYNAGLTLDSTYDRFSIILGGDVKIKQVWHIAGNGRDLDALDANYSTTVSTTGSNYVTDVTISGGRLILGTGGRLGTFYAKRINIESPIYGEALCAGVHVYSHTHGITFSSMWFDGTGSVSSYEAPFWADPYSATADSSQPSNISIGDYHVVSAFRYGLNLSARNVHIDRAYIQGAAFNGLRFYSALTNAGTVDTCRASNLTIDQLTVRNCGGSGSATNDHLYAGVLLDSYANDASIRFMDIAGSAENALKIYNNAHNINIDRLRADSNQTNLADNPTTRYAVHISGNTTHNINIGDAFIRYAPPASGTNVGAYGLVIDGARDITIGKVVAREGFARGVSVINTYQNVHIGQIEAKLDTNGVQVSGDNFGPLVIDDISTDSCYTYGMNLGGTSVGNVIRIGTALFNGRHTSGASDAGININSIAGSVKFDRLQARNYGTGGYGVFVQPNSTGDFTVDEIILDSNATGIDWSKGTIPATDNNKFTFGKVTAFGNTANWDADFRTDRLLNIGTIEGNAAADTTMLCGYPVNLGGAAPTNAYVLKFDASDSTWKPQADAGASGGDDVKFDSTTAAGGVVDLVNPVIQEGTNITFSFSGTDTVQISATGGASTKFIKTVDTNSTGETVISPDSIHVNDTGGINIDGKIVAGTDTLTLSIGDGGVTAVKMAPNSVVGGTGGTVTDNSLTASDIGANAVTSSELADGAVSGGTGGKISDATITGADLVDNTLTETDLSTTFAIYKIKVSRDTIYYIGVSDTLIKIKDSASTTIINAAGQALQFVGTGITLSGGSVINKLIDSTEVTNAADNGPGWFNYQWGVVDSARVTQPREGGDAFDGMVPKYKKRPSATAPDSTRYAVPVETSADVAVGAIDLATDVTGLLPLVNITAGTNGQVIKMSGTTVGWGTDATGGGGVALTIDTTETGGVVALDEGPVVITSSSNIAFVHTDVGLYDSLLLRIRPASVATGDMVSTFPYVLGAFNGYSTYPTWNSGTSATHPVFIRPRGGLTGTFMTVGGTIDTAYLIANTDNVTIDTLGGEGKLQIKDGGVNLAGAKVTGVLLPANGGTGTGMTNGQLLIGDGSGVPTIAAISNGTGTTVNNGIGSISIDATLGTSIVSSEITDLTIDSIDINSSIIGGSKMAYRNVEYEMTKVHLRPIIRASDSLILATPNTGDLAAEVFDDILCYDSCAISTGTVAILDTILITGMIPEDIIADTIRVVYQTSASAVGDTGIARIHWQYTAPSSDADQQTGSGTATGTSGNLYWKNTLWTRGDVVLNGATGVVINRGTRLKLMFHLGFRSFDFSVRIASVSICGRKR